MRRRINSRPLSLFKNIFLGGLLIHHFLVGLLSPSSPKSCKVREPYSSSSSSLRWQIGGPLGILFEAGHHNIIPQWINLILIQRNVDDNGPSMIQTRCCSLCLHPGSKGAHAKNGGDGDRSICNMMYYFRLSNTRSDVFVMLFAKRPFE